jgi:HPt (histidine-containing phosphotransfer) domain-containing protein
MVTTTLATLDLEGLRCRAGHDDALVCALIEDFIQRDAAMSELRTAIEREAFGSASELAHRMKGSLLALGANAAARRAAEVEQQASALSVDTAHDSRTRPALAIAMVELTASLGEALDAMRAVSQGASLMTLSESTR